MRIIIADQESSTRSALRMLLTAQPDMDLVGEAADLVELLSEIKANDPDLVILDWDVLGQRIDRLLDLLELFDRPPTIIAMGVHAEDREVALDTGGRPLKPGLALVYSVIIGVICISLSAIQRRHAKQTDSPLLAVDAKNWFIDGMLTIAVGVAFLIAWVPLALPMRRRTLAEPVAHKRGVPKSTKRAIKTYCNLSRLLPWMVRWGV